MGKDAFLSDAIKGTKDGRIESFEDLFLITYEYCYSDICVYYENEDIALNILKECYISVWNKKTHMPEENLIRPWLRIILKDIIRKKEGVEELNFDFSENIYLPKLIEDRAVSLLIDIEDELSFVDGEKNKKTVKVKEREYISFWKKILNPIFNIFVFCISVLIVSMAIGVILGIFNVF